MTDPTAYAAVLAEFGRARRIALTTHVKPDADALGAAAALRRWLLREGKAVETVVPTAPPAKYAFLDPEGAVRVAGRDVRLGDLARPDLVVVVDTATWQQLAGVEPLVRDSGAPVLVIDHHRTRDPLADWELVDETAAATVVLVHGLLVAAGAAIDAATATYLFAGLVGDTDWFRLPSVRPETFGLAGALVAAGADPTRIHAHLHLGDDLAKLHLWGRALETLHQALDGRATVMHLERGMFRDLAADIGDTENLINECMRVRGTRVGVMLVEADAGEVRVSLRSVPGVDVLAVAERFGGGGHVRAAGARLAGSIDRVEARVLEAVAEALARAAPDPEKA